MYSLGRSMHNTPQAGRKSINKSQDDSNQTSYIKATNNTSVFQSSHFIKTSHLTINHNSVKSPAHYQTTSPHNSIVKNNASNKISMKDSVRKLNHKPTGSSVSSFDYHSPNEQDSIIKQSMARQQSRSSINTRLLSGSSQIMMPHYSPKSFVMPLTNQNVRDTETFDDILKTKYDSDMQRYKYKSKNPDIMRKEGVQNFIFQKKLQNKLKYSQQSKITLTALPVAKGTVSIMLNIQRKDYGFNLQNFKKNIPTKSKFKMKWKTIQWLLNNRKDQIQQIFSNYAAMLKFARKKKGGMHRIDFGELLSFVGLGADPNLADKLFQQLIYHRNSIFDEDSSGVVDYKELIIGLEVFKDSTIDEKLEVFFDLCDADGDGDISQKELYNVLKRNLLTSNDRTKLMKIIKRIFNECDKNGDGVLDKKEILEASKYCIPLRSLLEESIRNVKQIDRIIENDLQEPFNCYVPISSNFANYKEGIYFPEMDEVFRALKEVEEIYQKNRKNQIEFKKHDKSYLDDDSLFEDID